MRFSSHFPWSLPLSNLQSMNLWSPTTRGDSCKILWSQVSKGGEAQVCRVRRLTYCSSQIQFLQLSVVVIMGVGGEQNPPQKTRKKQNPQTNIDWGGTWDVKTVNLISIYLTRNFLQEKNEIPFIKSNNFVKCQLKLQCWCLWLFHFHPCFPLHPKSNVVHWSWGEKTRVDFNGLWIRAITLFKEERLYTGEMSHLMVDKVLCSVFAQSVNRPMRDYFHLRYFITVALSSSTVWKLRILLFNWIVSCMGSSFLSLTLVLFGRFNFV